MPVEQSIIQAVDYFLALPNNSELTKHKISSHSWDAMKDIEFVLSVSYEVGYKTYADSSSTSTDSSRCSAGDVW
jgi:hypothetical protein